MIIKCKKLFPDAQLPRRASSGAVGYDVFAYHGLNKENREFFIDLPVIIEPGGSKLIGIGIIMAVPFPYDCQVRPRSGLANKHDVELSNAPGTIDPDYRGEASILLRNRGGVPFEITKGMRIAQLIFTKVEIPKLVESENLPKTLRGTGGFGSTGLQGIEEGDAQYQEEQRRADKYYMGIAVSVAERSNCLRGAERDEHGNYKKDHVARYCGATRRFGCVVVKDGNVIAQGCNTRTDECSEEKGCVREVERLTTGTQNDRGCRHAEWDAIQNYLHSGGVSFMGATVYVTAEPCKLCAKLLQNTGIDAAVVPQNVYPTNGLKLLLEEGVEVRQVEM